MALRTVLWEHCLEAARQIADDNGNANTTTAGLQGCGAPLADLLKRQAKQVAGLDKESIDNSSQLRTLVGRRLNDLIELAHARFYAYPPSDVPACWRSLYTEASILLFALRWSQHRETASLSVADLDSLVHPLDKALILAGGAGPPERGRGWIHEALGVLQQILEGNESESDEVARTAKRPRLEGPGELDPRLAVPDFSAGPVFDTDSRGAFVPPVSSPVRRSGPLGLEGFQEYLDRDGGRSRKPLVLSGMIDHWPARQTGVGGRPWSSPDYLRWRTLRGRRLVPVEVGRSYVDEGWSQAVVPFEDVLDGLGSRPRPSKGGSSSDAPEAAPVMYLAQHALFSQIPALQDDIIIPDACYTSTSPESDDDSYAESDVLLNAWLGPPGTITPLHTDPHHNLLAQVVGRKYVRLYAPEHTAALKPRGCEAGGVDMGNTSRVDVGVMEGWDEGEDVDEEERHHFRQVPYVDYILEAGDTLYIPQGWWHYVRGLSVSFSVSFWWN